MIRYAEPDDLPAVYKMAWAGFKELNPPEKIDPDLLYPWIEKAYSQAPQVLLEKDGQIIGFWGLCTVKAAWSHDYMLADYMFYILPEHRSFKATKQLKDAVCEVADNLNLTLRLSYLFNGDVPLHVRIYNMMGFKVSGLLGFYKGSKHGR